MNKKIKSAPGKKGKAITSDTSGIMKESEKGSEIKLTSFMIFKNCIKRANNLVNLNSKNSNISKSHLYDSYRAAIVLSISALDAYVRTFVIENIQEIITNDKKDLSKDLSDYIKNLLNQDKLLDAARKHDLMAKVDKAFREDFEKKSFQGDFKITSFMKLAGHEDIFKQISVKANVNEQTLRKDIELFTKRRHIIAHSGDYDLNANPPSENKITKKYAQDCIKLVNKIAQHINEIKEEKNG